jgi:hypothetical protein
MYRAMLVGLALVLVAAASAPALECRRFSLRDDFGVEPLEDCYMNYYYYTAPCPTYSWFWAWSGWESGDMLGAYFTVGDISMSTGQVCDPLQCQTLVKFRVLDFAGYGTVRPPLFSVEFDIYCCDDRGCPVGPPLWNSGRYQTGFAWNYVYVDPPLCITDCVLYPGPPPPSPRLLLMVTHGPYDATYPAWGFDNIGTNVEMGCDMHEQSCLQCLYPRPYNSHYTAIHSGFYGPDFEYCPPLWFKDQEDTTPDATQYGYVELAWRIYLACYGPSGVESTTWGNVKSIYR